MFSAVRCPTRSLYVRWCSSYIKQTRFLFELKENDDICRQALKSGSFYLFHKLSPLLQKTDSSYCAPLISSSELLNTLSQHGKGKLTLEDSVLVGCSHSCTAEFALDLGSLEQSNLEKELSGKFTEFPKAIVKIDGKDGSNLSRGQALLRWHENNQYCSKSGKPTQKNVSGRASKALQPRSMDRECNALAPADSSSHPCPHQGTDFQLQGHDLYSIDKSLTDPVKDEKITVVCGEKDPTIQMSPVVITLVSCGNRCLLANQETFPPGMYTALAGFCEIGETLEESIRREVAEEVGLEVDTLRYSASQHWPFPNSSLMVACQATAKDDKLNINREELQDARWFSLDEVIEALQVNMLPPKMANGTIPVWVPPRFAIAHHLIQEWVQEQKTQLKVK